MLRDTVFEDDQIRTLVILERTGGSLSLISVVLIFVAYGMFDRLRTLPNTFIVFASIANAFASIASIIAYDGVVLGQASSLCQAQGFLFHLFVQSDPWWSLAMAINVLLVFFQGASPHTIKRWGWLYCLICYGGPFVIAMVCLLLRDPEKTLVYGSAGLWCWVSNDWNTLRIYTYYMLIWICILTSLFIYAGIGVYVFRARNKLRQMPGSSGNVRGTFDHLTLNGDDTLDNRKSAISTTDSPLSPVSGGITFSYKDGNESRAAGQLGSSPNPQRQNGITQPGDIHPRDPARRHPQPDRHYHTAAHEPVSFALRWSYQSSSRREATTAANPVRRMLIRLAVEDPVKRAYLRTAVLFAVSVFVTWVPSSINRIRGLIYPDSPYSYNVATAAVLPLQGLWNGIIFFVTSWANLRLNVRDMITPGKGVVEFTDQLEERKKKATPTMTTYDLWRDAEQGDDDDDGGVLGQVPDEEGVDWKPSRGQTRRDTWNYVDMDLVPERRDYTGRHGLGGRLGRGDTAT